MSIQVSLVWKGHRGDDGRELRRDIILLVTGAPVTSDVSADLNAVKDACYSFVGTYYIDDRAGLIGLLGIECEDQGGGIWTAVAHFSTANFTVFPPSSGQVEFGVDIGSRTERIFQSKGTVSFATGSTIFTDGVAPDFKGSINVIRSGGSQHVEGADKEETVSEFTITWYWPTSSITNDFIQNIESLCNTVNNALFKGRATRTVRLRGATFYARTGSSVTPVTYRFAVALPTINKTIGTITGFNADGWDLSWVLYQEKDDGTSKNMLMIPAAAYAETVYDDGDFSKLGIGV